MTRGEAMFHQSEPHSVSDGRGGAGGDQNLERYPNFCLIRAARPGCLHAYLNISLSIFWLFGPSGAAPWPSDRAFGQAPGPISPTAQQIRDEARGASFGQEAQALEEGRPIKRELAGGQQHHYQIGLS